MQSNANAKGKSLHRANTAYGVSSLLPPVQKIEESKGGKQAAWWGGWQVQAQSNGARGPGRPRKFQNGRCDSSDQIRHSGSANKPDTNGLYAGSQLTSSLVALLLGFHGFSRHFFVSFCRCAWFLGRHKGGEHAIMMRSGLVTRKRTLGERSSIARQKDSARPERNNQHRGPTNCTAAPANTYQQSRAHSQGVSRKDV